MTIRAARGALLAVLLPLLPALPRAAGAQPSPERLAAAWAGGAARECAAEPAAGAGAPAIACVWRLAGGDSLTWRSERAAPSAASLAHWVRVLADTLDVARFADSLDAGLVRAGLRGHDCGRSAVPAGALRERIWAGAGLVVYLAAVTPPDGATRASVYALDPADAPRAMRCDLRQQPDTAPPPGRPAPPALQRDAVLEVETFRLLGDSVVTVVRYRTNARASDSAAVRRAVARRLGEPASLRPLQAMGPWLPYETAVLVLRPCYVDRCETFDERPALRRAPGDWPFRRDAQGRWLPEAAEAGDRAPRSATPPR